MPFEPEGGAGSGVAIMGGNDLPWEPDPKSPPNWGVLGRLPVVAFDDALLERMLTAFHVPQSYVVGKRLGMTFLYGTNDATPGNNVILDVETGLYRPGVGAGTDVFTAEPPANHYQDLANALPTITTAGHFDSPPDLWLTDASGEINGIPVGKGTWLTVRVSRDGPAGGDNAAGDLYIAPNSIYIFMI